MIFTGKVENDLRVWICEECKANFSDREIMDDKLTSNSCFGHKCKMKKYRKEHRCESYCESYLPEAVPQHPTAN